MNENPGSAPEGGRTAGGEQQKKKGEFEEKKGKKKKKRKKNKNKKKKNGSKAINNQICKNIYSSKHTYNLQITN